MSGRKKKKLDTKILIAKYVAIGAWAVPATSLIDLIKTIIKHFFK